MADPYSNPDTQINLGNSSQSASPAQPDYSFSSYQPPNFSTSSMFPGMNNTQGNQGKPWYQNEALAGAVAGSVKGMFDYLNMQEMQRGQRALQDNQFNHQTSMVNAAVSRGSTMPLLRRIIKNPGA